MIERSIEKMISTVTVPSPMVQLKHDVLYDCLGDFRKVDGRNCHVSAGPAATLQSTRQNGGQSGFIQALTQNPCLTRVYNLVDLTYEEIEPRPVRSAQDLLSWAVTEVHCRPTYSKLVRVHAISEASKARTVTVSNFAVQIIFGVLARMLTPALTCPHVVGGLKASRNLWNFLKEDLDPTDTLWGELTPYSIYGVSCDLEEATDYGNMSVARQILHLAIQRAKAVNGEQFPLGFAVLAKTMYLSPRYLIYRKNNLWTWATKRKGWLMGDRLTKYVLTVAHDYVLHSSGISPVASVVGDDAAILTNDPEDGPRYLQGLLDTGFKPSMDDYFVSRRLLFYCEEACSVPQVLDHLPGPCIRRKVPSCYQDYPRIRLLIPNTSETDAYSSTNVGRFALLGKETRWVAQNSATLLPLFERATRLQHMLLPTDSDTLCPYLPIEIGGDGSFTNDPALLRGVIESRSRDPDEVYYRIDSMMQGAWSCRYVRSERTNEVVHKHHLMVPIINETRHLIPDDAVISGDTLLINSIRVPQIEQPEKTAFRLWRSYYYSELFAGRKPPVPSFDVERSYHGGRSVRRPNISDFVTKWRDDGFTYNSVSDYLVLKDKVPALDYLNLGWNWPHGDQDPSARWWLGDTIVRNSVWNETSQEAFLSHIQNDTALPNHVRDRLYRFVDSDHFLAREVSRWEERPPILILVSKDVKLARRLATILEQKPGPATHTVTRRRVRSFPFMSWWTAEVGMSRSTMYRDLNHLQETGDVEIRGKVIPASVFEEVTEVSRSSTPTTICMVEPQTYRMGLMDEVETTLVTKGFEKHLIRTLIDYGAVNFSQFTEADSMVDIMEWDDWEYDTPRATNYISIVGHPRHRAIIFANGVQEEPTHTYVWSPTDNRWVVALPSNATQTA
jgi:hypothetical protein